MEYAQLGTSGLKVSKIGVGTLHFGNPDMGVGQPEVNALVDTMFDEGINILDTAHLYNGGNSEKVLGEALKGRREQMIICTKGGHENTTFEGGEKGMPSRRSLTRELEESLKSLQTDYIDIYMYHNGGGDLAHPPIYPINMDEVMRAFDDFVSSGKVRYLAGSNTASWNHCYANQIADRSGWPKMIMEQSGYSMMNRKKEAELLPYCEKFGVSFQPFFPLQAGFLTGKYQPGQEFPEDSRAARVGWCGGMIGGMLNDNNFALLAKLEKFAADRDRSVAELAIAWLLKHPAIDSVPVGATKPEHIQKNAKAADFDLTDEEYAELNNTLKEHGK